MEQLKHGIGQAKRSQYASFFMGALVIITMFVVQQSSRVFLVEDLACDNLLSSTARNNPVSVEKQKLEERSGASGHTAAKTNSGSDFFSKMEPSISLSTKGRTKIVGFSDLAYHTAALIWYKRLSQLGYTTHYIVATDEKFEQMLKDSNQKNNCDERDAVSMNSLPCFRFDVMIPEGDPKVMKKMQRRRTIFANRWKYILNSLKEGSHILITDVDNIFTRYVPMSAFEEDRFRVDALLAHSTGFPINIKRQFGLTFCGGMSWWRASPASIKTIEMFRKKCGDSCDDQVAFNTLVHTQLGMEWEWDPRYENQFARRFYDNITTFDRRSGNLTTFDSGFGGVLRDAILGVSRETGLRVRLWSREFAFRGPGHIPAVCPDPTVNWVAMPISDGNELESSVATKIYLIDVWEHTCGLPSMRLQAHNYSDGVIVKTTTK